MNSKFLMNNPNFEYKRKYIPGFGPLGDQFSVLIALLRKHQDNVFAQILQFKKNIVKYLSNVICNMKFHHYQMR